jgi:hypothetical protein
MRFLRGLKPALDRILLVLNGFKFCCTIRDAARELRHGREKSPAILGRERFDDNCIFWTLAHFALSTLQERYQLLDVYRFNWSPGRDGQNFPFSQFGDLIMGSPTAGRIAPGSVFVANLRNVTNSPPASGVPGHLVEEGFRHLCKCLFQFK